MSRTHQNTAKYADNSQTGRSHPPASSTWPLATVLSAHTPKKSASAPSSGVRRATPQPSGTPTSASTTRLPIATCMPLIDSGAEAASNQSRPSARRRTAGGVASGRATPTPPGW